MKTKHLVTLFSVFFLLSCNGPIVNRVTDNAIVTRDTGLLKVEFTKVYSGEQVNTLIRKVTAALPTCSSYSSSIYAYGFDSDYKEMEAIQESTVNIYGEAENEYGIAEAKITERHVNGGAFSVELSETIKEEFGRTNEGILLSKSVRTDYNGLTNTSYSADTYAGDYAVSLASNILSLYQQLPSSGTMVGEDASGHLYVVSYNEETIVSKVHNAEGSDVYGETVSYSHTLFDLNTYASPRLMGYDRVNVAECNFDSTNKLLAYSRVIAKTSSSYRLTYDRKNEKTSEKASFLYSFPNPYPASVSVTAYQLSLSNQTVLSTVSPTIVCDWSDSSNAIGKEMTFDLEAGYAYYFTLYESVEVIHKSDKSVSTESDSYQLPLDRFVSGGTLLVNSDCQFTLRLRYQTGSPHWELVSVSID